MLTHDPIKSTFAPYFYSLIFHFNDRKIEFELAGFPKYSFQKKKIHTRGFFEHLRKAKCLAKYQMQYFCGKKNLIFHTGNSKNNMKVSSCADFILTLRWLHLIQACTLCHSF